MLFKFQVVINILVVLPAILLISSACNEEAGSSGVESSGAPENITITGKIALSDEESAAPNSSALLVNQDIVVKEPGGAEYAKAQTGEDGSYAISVPGRIALGVGSPSSETVEEETPLQLTNNSLVLQTVIPNTSSGDVIGLNQSIDFSTRDANVLQLGETKLEKITAIKGRAFLAGSSDHTGIAIYIPGTSYAARTDSGGNFLMTFLAAGTYDLVFEKDGYVSTLVKGVEVVDQETSHLELRTLSLSGGASTFSIEKIGPEGLSKLRKVEFLINSGNADRFKGGLESEIANLPYGTVPKLFSYEFTEDGIYELYLAFANADGFESTVKRQIIVDTVPPSANGVHLVDKDSLNSDYTNERIIIPFHESCKDIDKVAILAADSEKPVESDFIWDCFSSRTENLTGFLIPQEAINFSYKIWVMDKVGHISADNSLGQIIFDEQAPEAANFTVSDQTSSSTLGTDITTVNISLSSCDDVHKILISENQLSKPNASQFNDLCTTDANAFTYTFSNNIEGEKTLLAWVMDHAGNIGEISKTRSITLDQTPPVASSFTLRDSTTEDTSYSNSKTVHANITNCDDTVKVLLSETQSTKPLESNPGWQDCSLSDATITLSDAGNRSVYLWAKDIGGNISESSTSSSIIVDLSKPDITGVSFSLTDTSNNSNLATDSTTVDVSISPCNDDYKSVYLSESSLAPTESQFEIACTGGSLSTTFTFANATNENKTVHLWVKDIAGNISLQKASKTIKYDTVKPGLPGSINLLDADTDSQTYTNSTTLKFTVDTCSGIDYLLLKEGQTTAPTESTSGWVACSATGTANDVVTSGSGLKTVYLWAKDEAGNVSNTSLTDTITWDSDAPSAPSVSSPSSPLYTTSTTVAMSGTAEANGSILVTGLSSNVTFNVDSSGNWSGNVTLSDNTSHSVWVYARDEAGNQSSSTYLQLVHDTVAPSPSSVSVSLKHNQATVSFTNYSDSSTVLIDYGLTSSYGSQETVSTAATYHNVDITSLSENTTYYYRIRLTDRAGNVDSANDYTGTFKTYIGKSGTINSETWNDTTNVYYVHNNLTLSTGQTLTISPDVQVRVASQKSIIIDGKLVARGASGQNISIMPEGDATTAEFWKGLFFTSNSTATTFSGDNYLDGNILEYVEIGYGGYNTSSPRQMIDIDGTGVAIFNSVLTHKFSNSWVAAIRAETNPSVYIRDSQITLVSGGYGTMIDISGSGGAGTVFELKDSTLNRTGYASRNRPIDFSGMETATITGNTFDNYRGSNSSNVDSAIYADNSCSGCNTTISGNYFDPESYSKGIYLSGAGTIEKNIFESQFLSCIRIHQKSSSTVNINNNIFNGCRVGVDVSRSYSSTTLNINYNQFISTYTSGYSPTSTNPNSYGPSSAVNMSSSSYYYGINANINYNLFYKNSGYSRYTINLFTKSGQTGTYTLNYNSFYENTTDYDLYTTFPSTATDHNVQYNFWNTTTTSDIEALLFDETDDNFLANIDYSNYLSAPHNNAPIIPVQNISVTNNGSGSVTVSWDANSEADLAGYRIYYGSSNSPPFSGTGATEGDSGSITAGSGSTSIDVTGLSTGTYYFTVTAYDSGYDGTDDKVELNESWYGTASYVYISN